MELPKNVGQTEAKEVDAKAIAKAETQKRAEAYVLLKELVSKEGTDKKFVDALKTVRPSLYGMVGGGRSSGTPMYKKVVQAIVDKKEGLSEMDLFKEFKIGRKETIGMLKHNLRQSEAGNRVWINFTPSDGLYKVVGRGSVAPSNYDGYIPVEESTDLK